LNYLIPVDAVLDRDTDVYDEAVSLERVLVAVEPAKKLRLVILDACRDNPFVRSMKRTLAARAFGRGLAKVEPTSPNIPVNFGAKPDEPPEVNEQGRPIGGGPRNKRAECYLRLKRALEVRFQIPDRDDLASELTCFGYYEDAGGFLVLEAKKDLKKRGLPSPDLADALALKFAGGHDVQLATAKKVSETFNCKIVYLTHGVV
jgi:hypothetical protein